MSKSTDERSTPPELFDPLNNEFHFTLDVCATDENHKCERYFTKEDNGLYKDWTNERCFMNPPYSAIPRWLTRATYEVSYNGSLVVAILPCDTSTRWFHDYLWDQEKHSARQNIQLRFPKGRYKFGGYTTSPKFATIIAVIGYDLAR